MIYILFIVSFLAYLALRSIQAYYEYFSMQPVTHKVKSKQIIARHKFPFTPKILIWSFQKSKKPNWKVKNRKTIEIRVSMIKSIKQFLLIFSSVAFVFSILQFWLANATDIDFAKASILKLEQNQFKIKEFVEHFKIASNYEILIAILLIALAGAFPVLEKFKINSRVKKYSKLIKTVLYVLGISTSFTFFGNAFASNAEGKMGELEMHKLKIIENNKLLLQEIRIEVSDIVVNEIVSNKKLESVLDLIEKVNNEIESSKSNDEYIRYVAAATVHYIDKLPIRIFENDFKNNYDFVNRFYNTEGRFENAYH